MVDWRDFSRDTNDAARGIDGVDRVVKNTGSLLISGARVLGIGTNLGSIAGQIGSEIRTGENRARTGENRSEADAFRSYGPVVQARQQYGVDVVAYNQGPRYTQYGYDEQTGRPMLVATPPFVPAGAAAAVAQQFVPSPAAPVPQPGPVPFAQNQQGPMQNAQVTPAPVGQPVPAAAARPAPTIVIQNVNQAKYVLDSITYAVAHVMEAPPNSDAQRKALQSLHTVLNTSPFRGEDTQLLVHPALLSQIKTGELSYDFTKQGAGHYRPPVGLTITAEQFIHGILDGNPQRYGALKQTISSYLDDPSKPLVQSGPPAPAVAAPVAANTPPSPAPAAPAAPTPPAPAAPVAANTPPAPAPAAPAAAPPPAVTPVVSRQAHTVDLPKDLPKAEGKTAIDYTKGALAPTKITQNQVEPLQALLKEAGYDLSKHGADGKFGPETLKAAAKAADNARVNLKDVDFTNPEDHETKKLMDQLKKDVVAKRLEAAERAQKTAQGPAAPAAATPPAPAPAAAPVAEAPAPAPVASNATMPKQDYALSSGPTEGIKLGGAALSAAIVAASVLNRSGAALSGVEPPEGAQTSQVTAEAQQARDGGRSA